jgi:hypothetical protein
MCQKKMYTIRSEDNYKLFLPNSSPPYPSRQTHPTSWVMTKKLKRPYKSQFGESLVKTNYFSHRDFCSHPYPLGPPNIMWGRADDLKKSPRVASHCRTEKKRSKSDPLPHRWAPPERRGELRRLSSSSIFHGRRQRSKVPSMASRGSSRAALDDQVRATAAGRGAWPGEWCRIVGRRKKKGSNCFPHAHEPLLARCASHAAQVSCTGARHGPAQRWRPARERLLLHAAALAVQSAHFGARFREPCCFLLQFLAPTALPAPKLHTAPLRSIAPHRRAHPWCYFHPPAACPFLFPTKKKDAPKGGRSYPGSAAVWWGYAAPGELTWWWCIVFVVPGRSHDEQHGEFGGPVSRGEVEVGTGTCDCVSKPGCP